MGAIPIMLEDLSTMYYVVGQAQQVIKQEQPSLINNRYIQYEGPGMYTVAGTYVTNAKIKIIATSCERRFVLISGINHNSFINRLILRHSSLTEIDSNNKIVKHFDVVDAMALYQVFITDNQEPLFIWIPVSQDTSVSKISNGQIHVTGRFTRGMMQLTNCSIHSIELVYMILHITCVMFRDSVSINTYHYNFKDNSITIISSKPYINIDHNSNTHIIGNNVYTFTSIREKVYITVNDKFLASQLFKGNVTIPKDLSIITGKEQLAITKLLPPLIDIVVGYVV